MSAYMYIYIASPGCRKQRRHPHPRRRRGWGWRRCLRHPGEARALRARASPTSASRSCLAKPLKVGSSFSLNWRDILTDRIRMLSCLQFPCLVSSALCTYHLSSFRCPDSNRLPSDLEASSHRTTSVRVGTWLFNQCHYEKLRPPVPLVLRRSTVGIKQ